jgi:hypothetical protein
MELVDCQPWRSNPRSLMQVRNHGLKVAQVLKVSTNRSSPIIVMENFRRSPAVRFSMTIRERKISALLMAIGRHLRPG